MKDIIVQKMSYIEDIEDINTLKFNEVEENLKKTTVKNRNKDYDTVILFFKNISSVQNFSFSSLRFNTTNTQIIMVID